MNSDLDPPIPPRPRPPCHPVPPDGAILEFVEKVETLSLFQDRIAKPSRMPQVWDAFRDEIERQISPAAMALFLVDQQTHAFELSLWTPANCEHHCRQEIEAQIECGTFAWIVNRRQPAIIPSLIFKGPQSLVMLPLTTQTRTLGVAMAVTTIEERAVTHERLRLLGILSKQCALVMENTLLYDQLKEEHQALLTAQTQIIQAEKFAAFGRLTAGVFHELLNPLNIISGHLQLMMMAEDQKAPRYDNLSLMKSQADRIQAIVNSLLQFSTQKQNVGRKLDLAHLLRRAVDAIAARRANERVAVEFVFEPHLPPVVVPEDDLKTALDHLIENAYDAMPEGGQLRIGIGLHAPAAEESEDLTTLEICIADSGCGISDNDVHKVFDPFFTTKDIGEGMGLSLAISYALIGSMGGTISFERLEKAGTVFLVRLPLPTLGP
jgi:signal transduction histidine kinase